MPKDAEKKWLKQFLAEELQRAREEERQKIIEMVENINGQVIVEDGLHVGEIVKLACDSMRSEILNQLKEQ